MPAAAAIPAPIAYVKAVAVKKLLVGFISRTSGPPLRVSAQLGLDILLKPVLCLAVWHRAQHFDFEAIGVFQAGACFGHSSME